MIQFFSRVECYTLCSIQPQGCLSSCSARRVSKNSTTSSIAYSYCLESNSISESNQSFSLLSALGFIGNSNFLYCICGNSSEKFDIFSQTISIYGGAFPRMMGPKARSMVVIVDDNLHLNFGKDACQNIFVFDRWLSFQV